MSGPSLSVRFAGRAEERIESHGWVKGEAIVDSRRVEILMLEGWRRGNAEQLDAICRAVVSWNFFGSSLHFLWIKIGNPKGHKKGGVFFDVM